MAWWARQAQVDWRIELSAVGARARTAARESRLEEELVRGFVAFGDDRESSESPWAR